MVIVDFLGWFLTFLFICVGILAAIALILSLTVFILALIRELFYLLGI